MVKKLNVAPYKGIIMVSGKLPANLHAILHRPLGTTMTGYPGGKYKWENLPESSTSGPEGNLSSSELIPPPFVIVVREWLRSLAQPC
jgi:hypothetical protein